MNKKILFIIIALIVASIFIGITSVYFYSQYQQVENEVNGLENKHKIIGNIPKKPLSEDYKKRITEIIERDIDTIISEEPSLGGKWFVTKIQFVNPELVIVEYEDGHNLSTSQISIIESNGTFKFKEVR